MERIYDQYDRSFSTLRISLTKACNLQCVYCVQEGVKRLSNPEPSATLSVNQLVRAVENMHRLTPFRTIRLTGGEPTLYKDLIPLIERLDLLGIPDIRMTTNGYLLPGMVEKLAKAGLSGINMSLDAIDEDVFFKISKKRNIETTLRAIGECLQYGIEVKINTVVLKGMNEHQILPLLHYAGSRGITIRFLELMKMGHLYSDQFEQYYYSQEEILGKIYSRYEYQSLEREKHSTANYWKTDEQYTFGIIANESAPFCSDCDRLRLDVKGNIYGCLSEERSLSIMDCIEDEIELAARMKQALLLKQPLKFKGSELKMISIGG